MKNVFPFSTGSAVTSSFATISTFSLNARTVESASYTETASLVLEPEQGDPGKGVCLVTLEQYFLMTSGSHVENCLPESLFPTTFTVTNSGASSFIINGVANDNITLVRGQTYIFNINAIGHPFWIQSVPAPYSPGDVYNVGIINNGTDSGVIQWTVDQSAPSTLYYVCQFHSSMAGTISII
jgi:hypothetical protein